MHGGNYAVCDSSITLTEASGRGGECIHCLPIKPEEGSTWLCPLSGQDVGGAAVARSGITEPPDPGACLGHPYPPTLLFAALGSSDANRRASVLVVQGDSHSVLLLLGRLFTKGVLGISEIHK